MPLTKKKKTYRQSLEFLSRAICGVFPEDGILGNGSTFRQPSPSLRHGPQILTLMLFIGRVAQADGDQDQEDEERPGHFQ